MKQLPKILKICNVNVDIVCDESQLLKINAREGRDDAAGYTLIEEQEILLDPTLKSDLMEDTLLHEVIHWVFYLAGGREYFSHKKEERFICTITSLLLDTLKSNPELRDYLFGGPIVDSTAT